MSKKKSKNWSSAELDALEQSFSKHNDELDPNNTTLTAAEKEITWSLVAIDVNKKGFQNRTPKQIKEKLRKLRAEEGGSKYPYNLKYELSLTKFLL